ncbi:unannotated protein [freshwater metagenome]|uniref:Unannotated protein n=1 Tax=freshwater metagenome TaxID=449393 RepID=A0A6J6N0W8_9ZZZZ
MRGSTVMSETVTAGTYSSAIKDGKFNYVKYITADSASAFPKNPPLFAVIKELLAN